MQKKLLTLTVLSAFIAREASAYEASVGIGRLYGCLQSEGPDGQICAVGPSVSAHWGFNLWGKGYDIEGHERDGEPQTVEEGAIQRLSETPSPSASYNFGHMFTNIDRWETVAVIVVASLFMVSLGYALLYPFSSRADFGFIGRMGYQSNDHVDLYRNEAGVYFRGYLSQHFPLYIYGSGLFSHQTLSLYDDDQTHNVFVKRLGLGLMSPDSAGLYFQGTWERSSLVDPSAKDVIQDATTDKLRNQSLKKILDASHFELGYMWYY